MFLDRALEDIPILYFATLCGAAPTTTTAPASAALVRRAMAHRE
jgi:hypothetical protein